MSERTEEEKDRRQATEWIKPPLSKEQTPVAESSLLSAVLAVGESNGEINDNLIASRLERRALQITVFLLIGSLIAFTITGIVFYAKLSNLYDKTSSVVNPTAQRSSIARSDYRTSLEIYCTNNFVAHITDPNGVEIDERCPSGFPVYPDDPLVPEPTN